MNACFAPNRVRLRVVTGDLLDKETINIKFQKVSNRVIFETMFFYFC